MSFLSLGSTPRAATAPAGFTSETSLLNSPGLFLDFSWVTGNSDVTRLGKSCRPSEQKRPHMVRAITALIPSSYFGRCRSKKAQITAGPFGSLGAGPKNRG